MTYLFTQEINPFELCPICYTTLLVGCCYLFIYFLTKITQASLVSLRGAAVEADRSGPREVSQAQVQFAAGLLLLVSSGRQAVLILALVSSPYQQILCFFVFFCRRVGSGSRWRVGEEEEERGKKKQPRGWRKILYACALKHKVCGQLLKVFLGGVNIIHRVNRVREGEKESVV